MYSRFSGLPHLCMCVVFVSMYHNERLCSIIALQWLRYALKKKSGNSQDRDTKKATKLLLKTIANHWTTFAPRVESQFGVEEAQKQKVKFERIERRMRNEEDCDR